MLAYSTVSHTGLFLIGVGVLTPAGASGVALYVIGHAGTKAALFACVGILLDRYGSVDEHELHGKGRELPVVGVLFAVGGLALAGAPPLGTALGKALTEGASGAWLTVVFVLTSAVTGGAVLRAAARVFGGRALTGRAAPPPGHQAYETSGEDEEPESTGTLTRVPVTMLAVPAVLLLGCLLTGSVPAVARAVARSVDGALPGGVTAPAVWSVPGVLLGLLSTGLAAGLAAYAVRRPHGSRSGGRDP